MRIPKQILWELDIETCSEINKQKEPFGTEGFLFAYIFCAKGREYTRDVAYNKQH